MSFAQPSTEVSFREIEISYGRKRIQPTVTSARGVAKFLRSIVPNNSQEHFIAVYLGGGQDPIGYSVICSGLLTSCPIHPRELYQKAVLLGAHSVIVAHNHPSDGTEPSEADKQVTKQLSEAGKVIGIKLLDHIIFTDFSHYSFQENGLL
jgi:DNA repair protein RadC